MTSLLVGAATAYLLWSAYKLFGRFDPTQVRRIVQSVAGIAVSGVALLLVLRGKVELAAILGGVAASLFGWSAWPQLGTLFGMKAPAPARLRSATIALAVDGASGRLSGTVLAGPAAGRPLDDLSPAELSGLRASLRGRDPAGLRLLEAYLDGRLPGWRENAHADDHPGLAADPQRGAMSKQEAYEVLGLQPGAGLDEIRRAHRALMKRLHPDGGGSTYLASRVNQAKDVLSDRHG